MKFSQSLPKPQMVCDSMCHSKPVASGLKTSLPMQIKDFFVKLFNTADWPPRWHCGTWTDFHGWLYIVSDAAIWAAYFAIPLLLFRIIHKRADLPFPKVIWLFIAFIMLCGTTHLLDAVIFWWPAYRLSALVRFATAVVSVLTVFALYKILPMVYNLRTAAQLEVEIEERKKAEEETRNQQILKQAAEELMERKDEFMSIASHELKTPITSVKASLQILERMADKNEAMDPAKPFIEKASKQVNKLTGIIHDLLDVTRIQGGKLELDKKEFNLRQMVNECVEQCRDEYSRNEIQIICDDNLSVYADRDRIDQVLCNLITNAIKYSKNGTLITVFAEKKPDGKTTVEVTDQGIGIAEDKIENIFDRFYRVENTSKHYSGIGLGLYISSEIVKRHGGEIGVKSKFGEGSTFWFAV